VAEGAEILNAEVGATAGEAKAAHVIVVQTRDEGVNVVAVVGGQVIEMTMMNRDCRHRGRS
jgi:hypothetical protein